MAQLLGARATWKLLRAGDLRARIRATREGQAALRLQLVAAAIDLGLLDALADGPADGDALARRLDVGDRELFAAFLRTAAAAGLVVAGEDIWRLAPGGRSVIDDDLVRASYEAFGGFHTELYRGMRGQLAGGAARRDVVEKGGVIARVSAAFEPFVDDALTRAVTERAPARVLDVGCGAGLQLITMLRAAPAAEGVGVDADGQAAGLARAALEREGLSGRATVLHTDLQTAVADGPGGPLARPFDLALLANVVYYVPVDERVALLRTVAGLLAPGGVLLLVTTVATPQLVSRHFDLLLRAQEGRMQLPGADELVTQLTAAGLRPGTPQRLTPGAPLVAVRATLPDRPRAVPRSPSDREFGRADAVPRIRGGCRCRTGPESPARYGW